MESQELMSFSLLKLYQLKIAAKTWATCTTACLTTSMALHSPKFKKDPGNALQKICTKLRGLIQTVP
jgi:hypothetical protein